MKSSGNFNGCVCFVFVLGYLNVVSHRLEKPKTIEFKINFDFLDLMILIIVEIAIKNE